VKTGINHNPKTRRPHYITKDHRFLRPKAEFRAKPWNLPGISMFSWNLVLASDKGTNKAYFGGFEATADN